MDIPAQKSIQPRGAAVPNPAIVPRIRPEEFGMFAAALQADPVFPQTFGHWLDRTSYGLTGQRRCAIEVSFDEFMAYCSSYGQAPGLQVLEAMATSKTDQQKTAN